MNSSRKLKTTLLPAVTGNVLEWYDFTLYAFFATIFAKYYFPADNNFVSLLEVYGLFGISFIMRPIGAMVFGYIGDRFGRKSSLVYSIILMGICSFLMSILPTYQDWGIFASISLILIRLVQGFAVGGEYSGASIYLIESAPKNKRTLFGSFALSSAYSGFVLSAAVGVLLSTILSHEQLDAWGWRLGFLFGTALAFIGYYLRSKLRDAPLYQAESKSQEKTNPLKNLLYYHPKRFLLALGIALLPAGFSYMIFVYLGNFLNLYAGYTSKQVLSMNMIIMIVAVIFIPLVGLLADKIGRRSLMLTSAIAIIVLCIPLVILLPKYALMTLLLFTILNALYESNIPTEVAEMFEASYRYSGLALTLNLTNGLAGGFAPIIASLLIHYTNQPVSIMYYIIGLSLITIFSLLMVMKGNYKNKEPAK
jgi:MFS transporter, MHS family, proline/betaine transporter